MKSVTKLIEAQVLAMAQAASLQSLPPLCSCTGEGSQTDEDGVDWWLECFCERAQLAGCMP